MKLVISNMRVTGSVENGNAVLSLIEEVKDLNDLTSAELDQLTTTDLEDGGIFGVTVEDIKASRA